MSLSCVFEQPNAGVQWRARRGRASAMAQGRVRCNDLFARIKLIKAYLEPLETHSPCRWQDLSKVPLILAQ
jgi:hypothetical protein